MAPEPGGHARRDVPRTSHTPSLDDRNVRHRILDATERLLSSRSFESLSVADILEAAGVSRASFYFYFPNKHAVLADLVRQAVAGARDAAATWTADRSEAPDEALLSGTRAGARLWHAHGPVLRAIVENWRSDPELTRLWTEMMEGFAEMATERIRADREAGRAPARDDDPKMLATILSWMSERAYYLAAIGHPGFADETRVADALTQVWAAAIYGATSGGPGSG